MKLYSMLHAISTDMVWHLPPSPPISLPLPYHFYETYFAFSPITVLSHLRTVQTPTI